MSHKTVECPSCFNSEEREIAKDERVVIRQGMVWGCRFCRSEFVIEFRYADREEPEQLRRKADDDGR